LLRFTADVWKRPEDVSEQLRQRMRLYTALRID
jgi:hypothetical protein